MRYRWLKAPYLANSGSDATSNEIACDNFGSHHQVSGGNLDPNKATHTSAHFTNFTHPISQSLPKLPSM